MAVQRYDIPTPFYEQLNTACKHYGKQTWSRELSSSQLSTLALRAVLGQHPDYPTDQAGRLKALEGAIRASLAKCQPSAGDWKSRDGQIYVCLYCYIYKRDPYDDTLVDKPATYVHKYAVSQSNYALLRNEGLRRLDYHLSIYLAERTTLLELIPTPKLFVGRESEQHYYRQQLETRRIAVIEGESGVGKTALAAQIARATQRPTCWLTVRPGLNNTMMGVVTAWAAFLARHNYPYLWTLIQAQSGDQTLRRSKAEFLAELSSHLVHGLDKVQPILCLDNLDVFPDTEEDFALLQTVRDTAHAWLLITSQRPPRHLGLGSYMRLEGLSVEAVQQLLGQQSVHVSSTQAAAITRLTKGNPRLLELCVAYMRLLAADADPAASLQRLSQVSEDLATDLAQEIFASLTADEQQAARLLALARRPLDAYMLRTPPDTVSFEDVALGPEDFDGLYRRGLIHEEPGEQCTLSPLIVEHLRTLPLSEQERALHRCLEQVYAWQGNRLECIYHVIQAGDMARAVALLQQEQASIIAQGQASGMSALLGMIAADALPPELRKVWHDLRLDILQFLGEYSAAEEAVAALEAEATTDGERARAWWYRGHLARLRTRDYQTAEQYYEHALRQWEAQERSLGVWIQRDRAWMLMQQEDYRQAWDEAQRAYVAVLDLLGNICCELGNYHQALSYLDQAVAQARTLAQEDQLSRSLNNRGLAYQELGALDAAISDYQKKLQLDQRRGDLLGIADAHLHMGICYYLQANYEQAIAVETVALQQYERLGLAEGRLLAHNNLAEAYLATQQLDLARWHSDAAIKLADSTGRPGMDDAEAWRIQAEVFLAEGDKVRACAIAKKALECVPLAVQEALDDPYTLQYVYRTLSGTFRACEDDSAADNYERLAQLCREKLQNSMQLSAAYVRG